MYTNINVADRVLRFAISLGVILAVISMSSPIGGMVYALFVSIYLGITASIGWDPVAALIIRAPKGATAKQAYVQRDRLLTH